MAVTWDWNKEIGTVDIVNYGEVVRYHLYQGNCFLIMLYEFTGDDGKDKYTMHSFFADKEHAKNCLGITKGYDNMFNTEYERIEKIRINKGKYRYTKDLVDMLIKAFDNISIEIVNED